MKTKTLALVATLSLLPLLFNCGGSAAQNNNETQGESAPLVFQQQSFSKSSEGCATDAERCAKVTAEYPMAMPGKGQEQAAKRFNDTLLSYVEQSLAFFVIDDEDGRPGLEGIAEAFLTEYEAAMSENPGMAQAWESELTGEVLYNSPGRVSIALSHYAYAGGAHPNSFVTLLMFDAESGQKLELDDVVTDMAALERLAEQAFRNAQELGPNDNLEEAGFFWGEGFSLPANAALTEEGLYCFYNSYEAAPYAMGPTEFTLTYEQLDGLLNGN